MNDRLYKNLNHRAVLQLFRAAHGIPVSDAGIADIQNASAEDLVRISSSHGIAPMMADGLDQLGELEIERDLMIFWQEIREGNRLRNRKMRAQLTEAAGILAEERIPVVVLKGGCHMALAPDTELHRRYASDLDLLVPDRDLGRAMAALELRGYQDPYADDEFYNSPEHHDAPLLHENWPAAIELHRTIGGGEGARFLPADRIFETAEATGIANVSVPSQLNRLVHSVFHAQVQDSGYRDRTMVLRTVADLATLAADRKTVDAAREAFEASGLQSPCDGLLAVVYRLLPGLLPPLDLGTEAEEWARTAIRRMETPRRVSLRFQARKVTDWIWKFATDSEQRSVYVAKLLKPGRFRRMAQTLRRLRHY